MIHFTADHHFFHKNIVRYCSRPFKNEAEMRKELIKRHNAVVKKEDRVYFVGDVSMLGSSQWERLAGVIPTMNGVKHLIFGNHDEFRWQRYLDIGFTSVHSALWLKIDGLKFVLSHDPSVYCMCDKNAILLCGHVHTLFKCIQDVRVVNVGVDMWNFRPTNVPEILDALGI